MTHGEIMDFLKTLNPNDFINNNFHYEKIYDKYETINGVEDINGFKFKHSRHTNVENGELGMVLATYSEIEDNLITKDYLLKKIKNSVNSVIVEKENKAIELLSDFSVTNLYDGKLLSEESLKLAITQVSRLKDQSGICNINCKTLLIGTANLFIVDGLKYLPWFEKYFPKGYIVNPYVKDNLAAILTDAPDGFKLFQRQELQFWYWVDNATKEIWFACSERYSFVNLNHRSIYFISSK